MFYVDMSQNRTMLMVPQTINQMMVCGWFAKQYSADKWFTVYLYGVWFYIFNHNQKKSKFLCFLEMTFLFH